MIVKGLVSVVTPCYNVASYLPRLLNSVLGQTYPAIEMIVVNDGSTDTIDKVVMAFMPVFREKGYKFTYIQQHNSGQSVAVMKGIECAQGEYLLWPDGDDYYASESAIEKMVALFESSPAYIGMVRAQERVLTDSDNPQTLRILGLDNKPIESKMLFEDCLLSKNGFYFCSGAYMTKKELLMKSTKWPFYTCREAGQNWQLMLPIFYHYRCASIQEQLYNVVERANSHSRSVHGYEEIKNKNLMYYNTLMETLKHIIGITDADHKKYCSEVSQYYYRKLFTLALEWNKDADIDKYYHSLRSEKQSIWKDDIRYYLVKCKVYWMWRFLSKKRKNIRERQSFKTTVI